MNFKRLVLLLLALVFMSACVPKVTLEKQIQKLDINESIEDNSTISDDVLLKVEWWRDYGDAQLDEIIDFTRHSSPTIQSIQAKYAQANSIIASTQARNVPSLFAGGGISNERFSENHIFPPPLGGSTQTLYQTGLSLNYDFDFWNARASRILSAKYSAMAQKATIDEMKLFLSSAICEIYLSWHFDEERIEILHELKELLTQERYISLANLRNGLSDARALNSNSSEMAKVDQAIEAMKRSIEGKKKSIAILGGFMPSLAQKWTAPSIQNFKAPLPKEIFLNLIAHRSDITVQKYIVLSKGQNIENAKAQFYPNISLSGVLGFISFDLDKFLGRSSFVPSTGVAFSLPLFDGGERKANLSERSSDYNSSVHDYNGVVIKAANEVVATLNQSRILDSELLLHEEEMHAQYLNVEIAQQRFTAGVTNKVPYLQAKRELTQTHLNSIALHDAKAILEIRLIKALGGGYEDNNVTH